VLALPRDARRKPDAGARGLGVLEVAPPRLALLPGCYSLGMSCRLITVKAWACKCERCAHKWTAASKKPPARCAACKSPNWNRPPIYKPRAS